MDQKVPIATLPFNPNTTPEIEGLVMTENPVLGVVDYSDKTFIVFGEATRTYKQQLRDLGGKFNKYLKERPEFAGGAAWIFMNKFKPKVYNFVNQVNGGEITQHEGIPQQGDQIALPTVVAPIKDKIYQYVKYKVFKPVDGMTVTIKAGGAASVGEVLQTETHRNIVDTVYIDLGGNTSKLVICNGRWQVWGYMVEHSVYFGNKEDGKIDDGKAEDGANPTSPTGKPADYGYEDIAGI